MLGAPPGVKSDGSDGQKSFWAVSGVRCDVAAGASRDAECAVSRAAGAQPAIQASRHTSRVVTGSRFPVHDIHVALCGRHHHDVQNVHVVRQARDVEHRVCHVIAGQRPEPPVHLIRTLLIAGESYD